MKLLTTEQVAEETGTPYRALLRWTDAGWIEPRVRAGSEARRVFLFDEENVRTIRLFDQLRHRFDSSEWGDLARAIQRSGAGQDFIAVTRKPGKKTPDAVEYRAVKRDQVDQLMVGTALVLLIALGAGAAAPCRVDHPHQEDCSPGSKQGG
jgi:DNA-binding transcriptional MerR regulator